MAELYDREIVVTVGTVRIASRDEATGDRKPLLRVQFKVERDSAKEPNKAEVSIFNLSKASRIAAQAKGVPVEIEAGYFRRTSVIFRGSLDYGRTNREGTDWITKIQATDGGKEYRSRRANVSLAAGTSVSDALKLAAEQMGVGLGNVAKEVLDGLPRSTATQYVKGVVLSGQAAEQLDKVAKRAGFSWSIQDGQIQLTRPGKAINQNEAIVLTSQTGLVGSPEQGEDGLIKARALLIPDLTPGRRVQIQAGARDATGTPAIDGFFRIEQTAFVGDTWGSDWYTDIEGKPIQ